MLRPCLGPARRSNAVAMVHLQAWVGAGSQPWGGDLLDPTEPGSNQGVTADLPIFFAL